MPKNRKNMPDQQQDERDRDKDIERREPSRVSQESNQQDQGGHFGGQHEKGRPFNPANER